MTTPLQLSKEAGKVYVTGSNPVGPSAPIVQWSVCGLAKLECKQAVTRVRIPVGAVNITSLLLAWQSARKSPGDFLRAEKQSFSCAAEEAN